MASFHSPLDVRRLDNGNRWEVLSPFIYALDNEHFEYVEVHKGFVTDFASVPFPLSRVFPPVGKSWDKPSVIHDFLYWLPYVNRLGGKVRELERGEADKIFLEAMKARGTPFLTRRAIYWGVRLGGWKAWDRYRETGYK